MRNRKWLFSGFLLVVFVLAQSACGNTKLTATPTTLASPTAMPSPTPIKVYQVGEVVHVGNSSITMDSVSYYENGRQVNFTIENNGSQSFSLDPNVFRAEDGDKRDLLNGVSQGLSDLMCGSGMVGQVLPGQKVKGSLCFPGEPVYPINTIYGYIGVDDQYKGVGPELEWQISGRPGTPVPYKKDFNGYNRVGDIIQLPDLNITLKSASFRSYGDLTTMIATIIIENTGSDVKNINGDQFDAYFASSTYMGDVFERERSCGMVGQIQPGHILEGTVCWNFTPTLDPVQINYRYDLTSPQPTVVIWHIPQ